MKAAAIASPFDGAPPAGADPIYLAMKSASTGIRRDARRAVEAMWSSYRHRATDHWVREFRLQTHKRFWEMYLTLVVEADRHCLDTPRTTRRDEGPDLVLLRNNLPAVVVEAVCATLGDPGRPNSVPAGLLPSPGKPVVGTYPEEQVILRITSVLNDKVNQRQRHVRRGLIDPDSPFVIALNCGGHFQLMGGPIEPMALKALFPVGHPFISIDRQTMASVGSGWTPRTTVTKTGTGNLGPVAIPTMMFATPAFSEISAVLCSNANVTNHGWIGQRRSTHGFVLIRNPFASRPVAPSLLPVDEVIDGIPAGAGELEIRRQKGRTPVL